MKKVHALLVNTALVLPLLNCAVVAASEEGVRLQAHSNMAVSDLQSRAEGGDARAQFILANEYLAGGRVKADCSRAIHWYKSAAQQGMALAQFALGESLAEGKCVPKDSVEAVHWFRAAAEQKNADAQESLSAMYGFGLGVPRDFALEKFWLEKAALQGRASAQHALGFLFVNTEPKDYRRAYFWLVLGNASATADHRVDRVREAMANASFKQAEKQLTPSQREELLKAALVWQSKTIVDRESLSDSFQSVTALTW